MEKIDVLRSKWDKLYHPMIAKILGAILILLSLKNIIGFSAFSEQVAMIISIAFAVIFIFQPNFIMFMSAVAIFISLAHVEGLIVIMIAISMLCFCAESYLTTALILFLPFTFFMSDGASTFGLCIYLITIYFMSKKTNPFIVSVYGFYVTAWLLLFGKFGSIGLVSPRKPVIQKTAAESINAFTDYIHLTQNFEIIKTNYIQILCLFLAVIIVSYIIHYLFRQKKLNSLVRQLDMREGINFIINGIILIIGMFLVKNILDFQFNVPINATIIYTVLAYILTRPFATEAVLQQTLVLESKDDEPKEEYHTEKSFDSWEDIAGYDNTKKEIIEAINPYVDSKEYKKMIKANMKPVKGILLFGPPGTGKTTIARAMANYTKMNLLVVSAGNFMDKYVGESEKNLRQIFKEAKESAPCIICFDEIEAFLQRRSNDAKGYERNIVNTFLAEMDGYNQLQDVLVVGTTNQPNLIDSAALRPGRFDKLIYVGAPDEDARKALFSKYLKGKANDGDIDLDAVVELTDRYTGADIKGVCEEAFRLNSYDPITHEQLEQQLKRIKPSFTLDMQEEYYTWSKKYNRSSFTQDDYKKKKDSLTWDAIKGMEELKEVLKQKIENPIKHRDEYKKYGIPAAKGILFFGPPGCGKTFFAKVLADVSEASFYTVNGPELLNDGIGKSEENLRKLFRNARETKPSILFFDEIDAIAESRSTSKDSVKIINQLLTELDGMESLDGVVVIAATNRPDTLDTALLRAGRFDTKIYIGMPDERARQELIKSSLEKIPNSFDWNVIGKTLEGYSCADIVGISNKAKEQFVQRKIQSQEEKPLSMEDFNLIVSKIKPSISAEELQIYENLKELESGM